jgi:hypothetical protein
VVRLFQFDLSSTALRFTNHWHYYFRGEILKTKEFGGNLLGKVISTEVDVMTKDNSGNSNLFSGLLTQYTLNQKHELEALYLTGCSRFSQTLGGVKIIPGDIFIIPYTTVQNLNIRYNFQIKQKKEWLKYIVMGFSGAVLLFSLSYPWFTDISIWKKILGTFLLFTSWLFLATLLMSFFEPSNGATKQSTRGKITLAILLLIMMFLSNLIFQVF